MAAPRAASSSIPKRCPTRELEKLTRRYATEISIIIGPNEDIPAPDMGTDGRIMAWIMDTISMHRGHTEAGTVTGKPVSVGGTLGRAEATGRGLLYIVQETAKRYGVPLEGATVAVQGFGKVGAVAAQLLHRARRAKSSPSATLPALRYNDRGLDIEALMPFREGPRTAGAGPAAATTSRTPSCSRFQWTS